MGQPNHAVQTNQSKIFPFVAEVCLIVLLIAIVIHHYHKPAPKALPLVKNDLSQEVEQMKDEVELMLQVEKNQIKERLERQLELQENEIIKLQNNLNHVSEKEKKNIRKQLVAIHQKKKQLQGSLQKIEDATEETLKSIRTELVEWKDEVLP